LLTVLVAVIVGVLLGVFLTGGDDEDQKPARVASVESDSAPAAEQPVQPEAAQPESAEPESAPTGAAEPESAPTGAAEPETAPTGTAESETVPTGTAEPETARTGAAEPESTEPDSAAPEEARQVPLTKPDEQPRVQEEPSIARAEPKDAAPDMAEASPPEPRVTPPSFDVVRVSPSGRAVIAGRAEPGSEVTVLDDGIALGSVLVDRRGEWVFVPEKSLEGGDRQLSLVQEMPNGDQVASEQVVVLSLPLPLDKPAAAAPAAEAKATAQLAEAESAAQVAAAEDAPAAAEAEGTSPAVEAEDAAAVAEAEVGAPAEEQAEQAVIAVLVERSGDGPSRILQSPDVGGEGLGEESEVTIRSVDYDSEGEVTLAGRTEPKAIVNVYVDEQYIGSAEASEEGEWQLSPEEEVSPGQHRLRIDKVDESGIVLARIETPISRARPEELLLGDALVVVQPGNSLWRIARRAYGGGVYYTEIYGANRAQILDPDMIFPGQILALPVLN
jgi:nucleoid-associated protein YgaU